MSLFSFWLTLLFISLLSKISAFLSILSAKSYSLVLSSSDNLESASLTTAFIAPFVSACNELIISSPPIKESKVLIADSSSVTLLSSVAFTAADESSAPASASPPSSLVSSASDDSSSSSAPVTTS